MNNLAAGYSAVGQPDRAVPLLQEVAEGLEKRRFQHEHAGGIINSLIVHCEKLGQWDRAETWRRKWLVVVKERSGPDSVACAEELAGLGWNLLQRKNWIDAEAVLRESLAILDKQQPDAWSTFKTRSLLGGALLGRTRYAEAEPLLRQGYEGMKERAATIPEQFRTDALTEAIQRLVALHEATGNTEEAARWRKELGPKK
jgi:hypothetical protein